MLHLEQLEARENPATVDLVSGTLTFTGDAGADVVSWSKAGTSAMIQANAPISKVGSFPAGWSGFNSTTLVGPLASFDSVVIDLGDGTNTLNLRNNGGKPVAVQGGAGSDTFNISSDAPTNYGNLDGITAPVSLDGGGGVNRLVVSDLGSGVGNTASVVGGTISGLSPSDIEFSGAWQLVTIRGSNSMTASDSFTLDSAAANLRIELNNGDDSVFVVGDTKASIFCNNGNDYVSVAAGVTLSGAVFGNDGDDTFDIDGVVTGGVLT